MFNTFRYGWGLLAVSISLVGVGTPLLAQGTNVSQNVAVLNDGRVFRGQISEVAGGYRISTKDGGHFVLPFDQISVTSASLVGAYEAYRETIKTPTADIHLSLAEWCIGNGLWAQAYEEVQFALKLEPSRRDAQLMLQRIDSYLKAAAIKDEHATRVSVSPQAPREVAPPASSVNSRSVHVTYMTKVQPILMNSCGSGSCHGQIAENDFKLHNVRLESRNLKLASEANLKILQTWIDTANPEKSPLLTNVANGAPHHRTLFTGRRNVQYQVLEAWVNQYAQELSSTPAQTASSPIVPVSAEVTIPPSAGIQQAGHSMNSQHPQGVQNAPELQKARQQLRPDSFDPSGFNSMMHGSQPMSPAR